VTLLLILALGEVLPSTQYVTNGIILATARHRALAMFALMEAMAVCGLMVLLLPILGVLGVGISIAVPAFLSRGVATMIHGCRILEVPLHRYVFSVLAPPVLCAIPSAALIWLMELTSPATTWLRLAGYSITYAALFGCSYLLFCRAVNLHLRSRTPEVPDRLEIMPELEAAHKTA
jgi:hypothetical protein